MRTRSHIGFLLLLFALTNHAHSQDSLCAFRWAWSSGKVIADVRVPLGYQVVSNSENREGILTKLRWQDSSIVLLQSGRNLPLPLLNRTKHSIGETFIQLNGYSRRGTRPTTDLFWREDALVGYNVAYDSVHSSRRALFDRSFESFPFQFVMYIGRPVR